MLAYSTRKTPVGRESDALAAVTGSLDFLDDGLFKRVYVSRDGKTVYKVAKGQHGETHVTEGREVALVAETAWIAEGKRRRTPGMPAASLWLVNGKPVLSMPFYPKDSYDIPARVAVRYLEAWDDLGLEDVHGGNWRADARGRPVVVDLGGWGNNYPDSLPSEVVDMCTEVLWGSGDMDHDEDCECDDCAGSGECADCGDRTDGCGGCHDCRPWCDECRNSRTYGHDDCPTEEADEAAPKGDTEYETELCIACGTPHRVKRG